MKEGLLRASALALAMIGLLAGCVAPVTYKARPESLAKAAAFRRVVIVPPDVEVSEISAGGVTERRDDWTNQVSRNLTTALSNATGYVPVAAQPLPADEMKDVQALLRTISMNHVSSLFAPEGLNPRSRPLTYAVGPIDRITGPAGDADAVLFVFARDAYSSAGRKALVALGFAVPAPAIATAALVTRDGTVEWFNYYFNQSDDLRELAGAQNVATALLAGLPRTR